MFFKNLRVFRLAPNWAMDAQTFSDALAKQAFAATSASEMQSFGWVSPHPESTHEYLHAVGNHYLITLCTEKKLLPSSVINQFAQARALEIEEQQGYKPGRKQMKEIKEQVTDELLPRAFSLQSRTQVWIDTSGRWLVVDAAAAAKCDEVMGALAKVVDPFPVIPLYTEFSPAASMTNWLLSDEPPASFSIDQTTELQSTNETRASVRYKHQSVDIEDVRKHVQSGKQCVRLAMTWADRISFSLTDNLDIKGVTPLDILKEGQEAQPESEIEQLSADITLMGGELSRLLTDLVEALGGEKHEAL